MTETPREAKLRRFESWLAPIGIPLVLVASVGYTWLTFNASREADKQAAEISRLATCRGRNSGNVASRRDSNIIVDGFDRYTAGDPEAQAFIDGDIRPQMSTPTESDQDCNRNGYLDFADYADASPPELEVPGDTLPVANDGG